MSRRLLLVYRTSSFFVDLDREILAREFEVVDWTGRDLLRPDRLARVMRSVDIVVGWFAGWHTVAPIAAARARRRPCVVITGGVDVAALPEIGYGMQAGGGIHRHASRWSLRHATALLVNSEFSRGELERNAGIPAARATVVHHGVPDPYGALPPAAGRSGVVTAGVVDERNLERKGLRAFVQSAHALPGERFTVIGRWDGDAAARLRAVAPPNVELTGWVERAELDARLARARVYVQASRHEGFGMSVAEAMLAGCVPVVTRAGALPEVVGETGVYAASAAPQDLAAAVRAALAQPPEAGAAARERVLREFPMARRAEGLLGVVERASTGT